MGLTPPPSGAVVSTREALDDLVGTACRGCGGKKSAKMSHCRKCYFKLPKGLRNRLYSRIGDGYEEAYTESLALLRKEKS